MPLNTEYSSTAELAEGREIAERVLAAAQGTVDLLRVAHVRALLSDAFPKHSVAVFTRNWDEDHPRLKQLLSAADDVEDIDLTGGWGGSADEVWQRLTADQRLKFIEADQIVRLFREDERLRVQVNAYGAEYEYEHDGWVEFDLALRGSEVA